MEKTKSYANGKLLITGEYLVLEGALALAVPTIPGQEMTVQPGEEAGTMLWQSYYQDEKWFEAQFSFPEMEIKQASDKAGAVFIRKVMKEALRLGHLETLSLGRGARVTTKLGFHPDWGLGSSSSLISNLATIFGIDPFQLFFNTQQGSGYDIACATTNTPLFYRLDEGIAFYEPAAFNPPFKENLALIYSGRKQSSAESVGKYLAKKQQREIEKGSISTISREIVNAKDLDHFMELLYEHEKIMSGVLDMPAIKASRFPDFRGTIKSLGAWGGDFILAASHIDFNEIKSYFSGKGLETVFRWEELIPR